MRSLSVSVIEAPEDVIFFVLYLSISSLLNSNGENNAVTKLFFFIVNTWTPPELLFEFRRNKLGVKKKRFIGISYKNHIAVLIYGFHSYYGRFLRVCI